MFLRNTEHIIGDSVSAMTPETITAPASVKANSRNSEPVRPPRKPIGAYTAASVMVIEITGPTISRAPFNEAWTGGMPSSRWRWMFSTTTMASSTTRPIASTIASSVRRLKEKPAISISVQTPISDSGIVITGITTLRSEARNRKITTTTISTASPSVFSTSSIEDWMNLVKS